MKIVILFYIKKIKNSIKLIKLINKLNSSSYKPINLDFIEKFHKIEVLLVIKLKINCTILKRKKKEFY